MRQRLNERPLGLVPPTGRRLVLPQAPNATRADSGATAHGARARADASVPLFSCRAAADGEGAGRVLFHVNLPISIVDTVGVALPSGALVRDEGTARACAARARTAPHELCFCRPTLCRRAARVGLCLRPLARGDA